MKNRIYKRITMILVLAACLLSLAYLQSETETVHEVNVVIDSMEFVVEQHQLNVEEGDSVRFTIHNRDEGVTHSFEIDGVEENNIRYGETATIELRIDELPDQLNYVCRQHPLMRGVLSLTGL